MPSHYLSYWVPKTVAQNLAHGVFNHAASDQYGKVEKKDTVWIVTVEGGTLFLIGRLVVGTVTNQKGAEKALHTRDVWPAKYHVLAKRGTAVALQRIPLKRIAGRLRFESPSGRTRLNIANGKVDAKQLQTVRTLTPATVELLENAWNAAASVFGKGPFTDIKYTLSTNLQRHTRSIEEEAKWVETDGPIYYALPSRPQHARPGGTIYFIRDGYMCGRAKIQKIADSTEHKSLRTFTGVETASAAYHVVVNRIELAARPVKSTGFQGFRYVTQDERTTFEKSFQKPSSKSGGQFMTWICWNSEGWRFPTGEAKSLEAANSYVVRNGFGHEEWLFDFARRVDGYHYGFLQGVSTSRRLTPGQLMDVILFTIDETRRKLYVGEIHNAEYLSSADKARAVEVYTRRGWFLAMREEILQIKGKAGALLEKAEGEVKGVFNIRFRPEDVILYDPPREVGPKDVIAGLHRYQLYAAGSQVKRQARRMPRGRKIAFDTGRVKRKGTREVEFDPRHKALQNKLFKLLRREYGRKYVVMEKNYVDVAVTHPKRKGFYEIKPAPTAEDAIRQALGQLLDYSYRDFDPKRRLVVVSTPPYTKTATKFVEHLRARYKMPIEYRSLSLEQGDFE